MKSRRTGEEEMATQEEREEEEDFDDAMVLVEWKRMKTTSDEEGVEWRHAV